MMSRLLHRETHLLKLEKPLDEHGLFVIEVPHGLLVNLDRVIAAATYCVDGLYSHQQAIQVLVNCRAVQRNGSNVFSQLFGANLDVGSWMLQ